MNVKVLGLPNEVQELCPDIPELDILLKEIGDLAESGARYTEMPHVIEITLPMLCNYLPRWWERGTENFPDLEGQICTEVTAEHLNQLLGSIMKIVVNNLGIDEASWMKRLAGEHCSSLKCVRVTRKTDRTSEITPFVSFPSVFTAYCEQGETRNAQIPFHPNNGEAEETHLKGGG